MDLIAIAKEWLARNGYDGLYSEVGECGCLIDDLAPCGEPANLVDCTPGYKRPCNGDCEHVRGGGSPCEFHMGRERP